MVRGALYIRWTASEGRCGGVRVYRGLALASEHRHIVQAVGPDAIAEYPDLRAHRGSGRDDPSGRRLYALRDASAVAVETIKPKIEGTRLALVRLDFTGPTPAGPPAPEPADTSRRPRRPGGDARGYAGFLLTTGLSVDDERSFFREVTRPGFPNDWEAIDRLLRRLGYGEVDL